MPSQDEVQLRAFTKPCGRRLSPSSCCRHSGCTTFLSLHRLRALPHWDRSLCEDSFSRPPPPAPPLFPWSHQLVSWAGHNPLIPASELAPWPLSSYVLKEINRSHCLLQILLLRSVRQLSTVTTSLLDGSRLLPLAMCFCFVSVKWQEGY